MPQQPKRRMSTQRRASKNRSGDAFYSSRAWIALRNIKRSISPWCESCEKQGALAPTEDIDHIKPRATHPELELVLKNLQGLCKECHSKKTAREVGLGCS